MPRTCVMGCKTTEDNKLHVFPKNRERYNIWLERLCAGKAPPRTELHACRRHFHKRFHFQWGLAKTALPEYFLHPDSKFSRQTDAGDSKENFNNAKNEEKELVKNSRRVPIMNAPTLLYVDALEDNNYEKHASTNLSTWQNIAQGQENVQTLKCTENVSLIQAMPSNVINLLDPVIPNNVSNIQNVPALSVTATPVVQSNLNNTIEQQVHSLCETQDIDERQMVEIVLPEIPVKDLKDGVIIYQKDNMVTMEFLQSQKKDLTINDNNNQTLENSDQNEDKQIKMTVRKLEKLVAELQQSVLKINKPRKVFKFTTTKKNKSNNGIRKSYRINGKEPRTVIKSNKTKIKKEGTKSRSTSGQLDVKRFEDTSDNDKQVELDELIEVQKGDMDDVSLNDTIDGDSVIDEDYMQNRENETARTDFDNEEEREVSDDNLVKEKNLKIISDRNQLKIQESRENNFNNSDLDEEYCNSNDYGREYELHFKDKSDNTEILNDDKENNSQEEEECTNLFNSSKDNKGCNKNSFVKITNEEEIEIEKFAKCKTSTTLDIVILNNHIAEKQLKTPNEELLLDICEEDYPSLQNIVSENDSLELENIDTSVSLIESYDTKNVENKIGPNKSDENVKLNNIIDKVFNEIDNNVISVDKKCAGTTFDEHNHKAYSIESKFTLQPNDKENVIDAQKGIGKSISPGFDDNINKPSTESKTKVKVKREKLYVPPIFRALRSKTVSNKISVQSKENSCAITPNESKKYFLRTNTSPLKPLLKANLKNELFAIENNNSSCNKRISTFLTTITEIATPSKHIPNIETPSSPLPSIISTSTLPTIQQKIEPPKLSNKETSNPSSHPIVMPNSLVFQSPFVQQVEPAAPANDQFVLIGMPQPLQIKPPNQSEEQLFLPDSLKTTENIKYCHSTSNTASNVQQPPAIQKEQNLQNQKPKQQSLLKKNWHLHKANEAEIPLQSTCVDVQTDFTFNGICALVDTTRFHLNCYYCSEVFPLQLWSQFIEHIQTKHDIKKVDVNDDNRVLTVLQNDHDYTPIRSPPDIRRKPLRRVIIEKEIIIPNDKSFTSGNYINTGDDSKSGLNTSNSYKNNLRELSALLQKKYAKIRKQNFNSSKVIDLTESFKQMKKNYDNIKNNNIIIPINDSNSITDMTSHDIAMPLECASQKSTYVKQQQHVLPIDECNTKSDFNIEQVDPLHFVVIPHDDNSPKRPRIIAYDPMNSLPILEPTYQTFDMLPNDENEDDLPDNNSGIGIVFGQTNRAVVIDFLHNLQEFPLLYKRQKDCYQKDYDEAISKMCYLLNEKYHVGITDLELRYSIRRVIDWYCYTLDDIERHNRVNKMRKIKPSPPYPHAFPEFFEICARFLPNTRVCDNLLMKRMAPVKCKRSNQEIAYPSWVVFSPKSLNNQESNEQQLSQSTVIAASSEFTECPNESSKVQRNKKQLSPDERSQKHEKTKQKKVVLAKDKSQKEAELQNKRRELRNRILRCETCGREFRNRCLFRVHKIHHQPPRFKCDHCDKKYYHNHQLQRHIKAKHNPIPPYVCEFCGVALRSRGTLKIHLDNKHYNIRFPCVVCEYTTYSASKLAKHQRKWHVALEGAVEQLARRRYSLNNTTSLWKNSVKIPGIKNYTCTICHLVFKNLKDVKQHNQRLHPIRDSTYICPLCKPDKMITRSSLRRHFRNIHDVQPKDMKEMMKRSKPVLGKKNRKSEPVPEYIMDINEGTDAFNVLYEELIENEYNVDSSVQETDDRIAQEQEEEMCDIIDTRSQDVDELGVPLTHEMSLENSLNEEHLDPILDVTTTELTLQFE